MYPGRGCIHRATCGRSASHRLWKTPLLHLLLLLTSSKTDAGFMLGIVHLLRLLYVGQLYAYRMVSSSCSIEVREDCGTLLSTPTTILQQVADVSPLKTAVTSIATLLPSKIESSMEVEGTVGSHNRQTGPEWGRSYNPLDSDSKLTSTMLDGVKHHNVNKRVFDSCGDALSDPVIRDTKVNQGIHEKLASSLLEMNGTKHNSTLLAK